MTVKILRPGTNATQDWEHSPARNPPAASRRKALARQAEIRAGNGDKQNATHQDSGPFPSRETPKIW
jgi:hypothetical protein